MNTRIAKPFMNYSLRFSVVFVLAVMLGKMAMTSEIPKDPEFIGVDEISSGDKAVGFTVFSSKLGLEPFDVTILGVMRNFLGPGQDLIIAELSGERFQKSGVVSGMSGSPVYVGNRLLGALGYGLGEFTDRPVAGITPIKNMVKTLRAGGAAISQGSPRIKAMGLSLVAKGINPLTLELFKEALEQKGYSDFSLAAQTLGNAGNKSEGLFAGGPVAAVVVDGDMSMAAIGTVTYIKGNDFVAFGHPFMQSGKSRFAVADAEIVTTVFSEKVGYKMGQPTQLLGTLYSDRAVGIAGKIGTIPDMIPMSVAIDDKNYQFRIAPLAKDSPLFMAITLLNSLLTRTSRELGGTLDAEAKVRLKSGQEFTLHHRVSGKEVPLEGELAKQFFDELQYVLEQPFVEAELSAISFKVQSSDIVRRNLLLGVYAKSPVNQGQLVPFRIKLQPWQSQPIERTANFRIPQGLQPGDYQILVADKANAIRIESESGLFNQPSSFDLVLKQIKNLPSEVELCFYLQKNEQAMELSGFSLPKLPIALQMLTSNFAVAENGRHGKSAVRLGCEKMEHLTVGSVAGSVKVFASKEGSVK